MLKRHNPQNIAPPISEYAQAVEATTPSRWLYISGQGGTTKDGELAGDTRAQTEMCFDRIFKTLRHVGMTKRDLVKLTVYLTNANEIDIYREVRDAKMEGIIAASMIMVVSGLAHPDWTIEIEAVAATA